MVAQILAIVSVFLMGFPFPPGQVEIRLHEKNTTTNNGGIKVVAPIQLDVTLENYTLTVPVSLPAADLFSTAGLPGELDALIDVINTTAAAFPAVAAVALFSVADLLGTLKSRQQFGKFTGVLETNIVALGKLVVFVPGLVVVLLALCYRNGLGRGEGDYYTAYDDDNLESLWSPSSFNKSDETATALLITATTAFPSGSGGDNSGSSDKGNATTGRLRIGRPPGAPNIQQDRNPNGTLWTGQMPLKYSTKRKLEAFKPQSSGSEAALERMPQRQSFRLRE